MDNVKMLKIEEKKTWVKIREIYWENPFQDKNL